MKATRFAQQCSRIAKVSSDWAADALDDGEVREEAIRRYLEDIRKRLNWIEGMIRG